MTSDPRPVRGRIKVLVVDDSALIRSILKEIIDSQPDMKTVGVASHPLMAREMIKTLNPDVLTLDVEMPQMDGLTFLDKLMRLRPMPVLMISSLTARGSDAALRAMELGAIDFITKPKLGVVNGMNAYAEEIADKIRVASHAHLRTWTAKVPIQALPDIGNQLSTTEKIIAVGASTGGTEALKAFLMPMPADTPAILVAQHMPEAFTRSFAARLDGLCKMTVKEAEHNERILSGHVYIAPGHSHLMLKRSGTNYLAELSQSDPVNHHRPSVDVLFRSVAKYAGPNVVGVMLTGMGKDGAIGLREMREAGSYNFAQDEATSVVFGMPREAIAVGAVDEVLPISEMAVRVLSQVVKVKR